MGGYFGAISHRDVGLDVFFGTDYHSHLGTRRGGMVVYGPETGFVREIHDIENTPFRTKFESALHEFKGHIGMGCISDTDPQPLLVRSHLGLYAICTVGIINNIDELIDTYFSDHGHQFMAQSSGKVNVSELVAALINMKENLVEGILYAQEMIKGSITILLMTPDGILAARDRLGRLPVLVGKHPDGSLCVSFESFAYHKLGYEDAYELGPREIVALTRNGYETVSPPGKEMKICGFLWTYYGYPNSNYEGVNVEVMRYRNGEIMARDEVAQGRLPKVDYVAGFRRPPRHRLRQPQRQALRPPLCKVHPHLAPVLHPCQSGGPQSGGQNEADPRFRADSGKKAAVCGRFHRPGHPAPGNGGLPL